MKILVATEETQGQRESDFFWTDPGEIVCFTHECDRDRDDPDGPCGCRRSMSGVKTKKGTSTVKVVELDVTQEGLADMIGDSRRPMDESQAKKLLELAARYEVGTILEKRGDVFRVRER